MSADQQTFSNELRGALFRNDKGDNPARPDYRGNVVVESKKYRVSGWVRQSKSTGQTFLSLALTLDQTAPPDAQAQPTAPGTPPAPEDIPF